MQLPLAASSPAAGATSLPAPAPAAPPLVNPNRDLDLFDSSEVGGSAPMSLRSPGYSEDNGGACSTGSLPWPRAEERVACERWSPNFPSEYPLEQTQHYAWDWKCFAPASLALQPLSAAAT
eukprot:875814-Pyramimonas_sp.AAC.1